jgi:lipoprotein signal peptidase
LWALALVGFTVDQVGKYTVFDAMDDEAAASSPVSRRAELSVIPGALKFHVEYEDDGPHVNRGAFLGLGDGHGTGAGGNVVFAVVSVLAAGAIIWWSTRRSIARDAVLCVSLGLILGGTLGNLYDRIVFAGVRDYLYWYFVLKSAVFNLADFFLICGASLLLVQAFWGKGPAREPKLAREAHAPEMAAWGHSTQLPGV